MHPQGSRRGVRGDSGGGLVREAATRARLGVGGGRTGGSGGKGTQGWPPALALPAVVPTVLILTVPTRLALAGVVLAALVITVVLCWLRSWSP